MLLNDRLLLEYNVTGQTLKMYPPEILKGAVSGTTTYSVWKGSASLDNDAEFSGNATSDSVSTTVDANSGISSANSKLLNLAATTSIGVGEYYLVTNASGQSEVVKVVAIDSDNSVTCDVDLTYDYVSGDAFVGIAQSFTVDATFIQDSNKINDLDQPYKIKWSYTVNSVAYRHYTYFDVVRIVPKHNVVGSDLVAIWPELAYSEPNADFGEKFKPQIDEAFDAATYDLDNHGIKLSQIRDSDLDRLVKTRAILVLAEAGMAPGDLDPALHYDIRRANYRKELETLVGRIEVDTGRGGGTNSQTPIKPLFTR